MAILHLLINIGWGVWLSYGQAFWIYPVYILLVVLGGAGVSMSTQKAIADGRGLCAGHFYGLMLALIAFRSNLLALPIWLLIQVALGYGSAWQNGFIGKGKYSAARAKRREIMLKSMENNSES